MGRAVFRNGDGMWPRTGHGETFRRGRPILQQAEFMTPTGELDLGLATLHRPKLTETLAENEWLREENWQLRGRFYLLPISRFG